MHSIDTSLTSDENVEQGTSWKNNVYALSYCNHNWRYAVFHPFINKLFHEDDWWLILILSFNDKSLEMVYID